MQSPRGYRITLLYVHTYFVVWASNLDCLTHSRRTHVHLLCAPLFPKQSSLACVTIQLSCTILFILCSYRIFWLSVSCDIAGLSVSPVLLNDGCDATGGCAPQRQSYGFRRLTDQVLPNVLSPRLSINLVLLKIQLL